MLCVLILFENLANVFWSYSLRIPPPTFCHYFSFFKINNLTGSVCGIIHWSTVDSSEAISLRKKMTLTPLATMNYQYLLSEWWGLVNPHPVYVEMLTLYWSCAGHWGASQLLRVHEYSGPVQKTLLHSLWFAMSTDC